MEDMKSLVLYPENGAPIRFEKVWGFVEDPEEGTITFSYKDVGVNFFATFQKDSLIGIAIEA